MYALNDPSTMIRCISLRFITYTTDTRVCHRHISIKFYRIHEGHICAKPYWINFNNTHTLSSLYTHRLRHTQSNLHTHTYTYTHTNMHASIESSYMTYTRDYDSDLDNKRICHSYGSLIKMYQLLHQITYTRVHDSDQNDFRTPPKAYFVTLLLLARNRYAFVTPSKVYFITLLLLARNRYTFVIPSKV
jgi:hypothetical protein